MKSKKIVAFILASLMIQGGITLGTVSVSATTASSISCSYAQSNKSYNGYNYEDIDSTSVKITGCTNNGNITIPSTIYGKKVTEIDYKAFYNKTGLQSVVIPGTVKKISEEAFEQCTNLKIVTLSQGIETISTGAFDGCKSLTNIVIPNSVKILDGNYFCGGAFEDCTALKSVTLSQNISKIGDRAFKGCTSLGGISFPNSVKEIGNNAFENCDSIKSITLNKNISKINDSVFMNCDNLRTVVMQGNAINNIPYQTFANCIKLENITIGSGVKNISTRAFICCKSLKSIVIPNNVTTIEDDIWLGAFEDCTSLKSIILSNNLTHLGKYTFRGCKSLTKIKLPNSLKSIEYAEFYDCTALKGIQIPKNITNISDDAFEHHNTSLIIYGENGSAAQKYAKNKGIKFVAGNMPADPSAIYAAKISFNKTNITLGKGETYNLTTTFNPWNTTNKSVSWNILNTNVLSVSKGKITAKQAGTAFVVATTSNGKKAVCNVTVKPAASGIKLNKTSITLRVGQKYQLQSYVQNGASYKRGFCSSNGNIAHTNGNGLITAKKVGTAYITVKTYNGKTAKCKVKVVK